MGEMSLLERMKRVRGAESAKSFANARRIAEMGMSIRWVCLMWMVGSAAGAWKAGVARVDITPGESIWMSGYAARTKPSQGVLHPLWAKALAVEDGRGGRVVMVTTDLIGLPRAITDQVSARAAKEWNLERSQIVFNSSHTHTGPIVRQSLINIANIPASEMPAIERYGDRLTEDLYAVIGAALGKLAPAQLRYRESRAGFAINRRNFPEKPTDHTVPVIEVASAEGKTLAIVFGYACHNTTLTAQFHELSGDYAGFAQIELERQYPGATAMFVLLAAADQNPNPRSELKLAEQHGASLARAVGEAMKQPGTLVRGRLRTAFQVTDLPFAPRERADFEAELKDANAFKVRRAELMLAAMEARRPVTKVAYPVQAVRLGDAVTLLALGGELVVDYDLQIKALYPKQKLMVAGYSNDVMCYIPTRRILREGGYEANDSMIYFGQPGPFTPEVEDLVMTAMKRVLTRVGVK